MKQMQTFKFDPDLIKDLKKEAHLCGMPFNSYTETLLENHPSRVKRALLIPKRKQK
jgi:hypothetical protein